MKRFMLSAAVLLLTGGLALAQNAGPLPVKPTAPGKPPVAHIAKSISGKIQSVSEADAARGTKSELTLVNQEGVVKALLVKAGTTIYDGNGKPLTLKDLNAGDLVKVNYKTSAEGVLEAVAMYQAK